MLSLVCVAQGAAPGIGPGEVLLVEPADAGRYWAPQSESAPRYPPDLVRAGVSGCVSITFLVSPDGSTSGFQLLEGHSSLRSTPASRSAVAAFAKALVAEVKGRRYLPGSDNPDRLPGLASEYADFGFDRDGAWGRRCEVTSLRESLQAPR